MRGPARLITYLKRNKLTYRDFGRLVGASCSLVHRWAAGQGQPGIDYAFTIQNKTGGFVSVSDWRSDSCSSRRSSCTCTP